MNQKVILISIDGMRPDGFLQCNNPFIHEMMERSSYTLEGSSMNPSVTLPCHMSIFHSVTPERHGMTTNTYMPMVRPVNSLFEQIKNAGKQLSSINLLDFAPTIADIMGVPAAREWEGKSIVEVEK